MKHDTTGASPENANGLLLVLRGWSRGCAALARREFARSLGRKRFTAADREAFAKACAGARNGASAVTAIAALVLAARPTGASADILRGSAYANPGAGSAQQQAALIAAQQRQAAQVQRARDSLARTTQALQAMRLAQDAARSAASMNAGNIFNGLGAGGLRVAAGATPGTSLWQNAEAPKESVSGNRTQVEIVQTDKKAVLTWDEFNIGQNTDLYFNQKAGGADAPQWIALNRVTDATTNLSQILGSMKAEGQVYVINPNGVVFHGSSQVNVHTLVASGLDFKGDTVAERDAAFQQGLAADDNRANYSLGVDDGSGRKVGDVTVNQGARLVSDGSGAIYLFGKNVSNAGTILAPDGQALMAAGDRVWVTKNTLTRTGATIDTTRHIDKDLRGVRATVQNDPLEADGVTERVAGRAVNSGLVEAVRGNVTLSAKHVENSGALHTTTTTKANGSITLVAGDATAEHAIYWMWPKEFGAVTLAPGSLVAITPDTSAGTAFSQQYRPGRADIFGHSVRMDEGARIYAPSANLTMVAKTHAVDATAANDTSRIHLAAGSEIDLGGLAGVEVAMERNTISANLRLDELKDSPLLRESPLRGAKVSVDLRRGTTLADMSGHYGLIEYGVEELMTTGGSLKLDSGAIVTRAGSSIDLSGGSVQYLDGYVESTRLMGADGRIYDITNARKDIAYTGVYDTYKRFEKGYAEGRNAGSLIIGPQPALVASEREALNLTGDGARPYFVAFDGDLAAGTTVGLYQRNAYTGETSPQAAWKQLAKPAALTVGYVFDGKFYGSNIRIGEAAPLPADFGFDSAFDPAGAHNLVLPSRFFDGNTFGAVNIITGIGGGDFTVDAGVTMNLGVAGALNVHGARATINGAIVARGGSVSILTNLAKGWAQSDTGYSPDWETMTEGERPSLALGSSGKIDVAGEWVNDLNAGFSYGRLVIQGGSVELKSAYRLHLAPGSVVDVGGGGHLSAANRLTAGDAGSILLQNDLLIEGANGFTGVVPTVPVGDFDVLEADLRGYALGKGGSLTLGASRAVAITAGGDTATGISAADTLSLSPDFFRSGGFADFTVAGSREVRVTSGVTISPLAKSLIADGGLWSLATGGDIGAVLPTGVNPVELRAPGSLTLAIGLRDASGHVLAASGNDSLITGLQGAVIMETGSRIAMDPGSSVVLLSLGDLSVDGEISTPGGDIRLGLTDVGAPALRLGANARLLAPGYVRTTYVNGLPVRSVESAGRVSLEIVNAQGNKNHLYVDRDSLIDVSGISGTADLRNTTVTSLGGPVAYKAAGVAGDAGSVLFEGFKDGYVAGRILAAAGGESAAGGTITVHAGDLITSVRTGIVLTDRLTGRATESALFPTVGVSSPVSAGVGGTLTVYAPVLRESGADNLSLLSSTGIAFDGDIRLSARRSLDFGTPSLGLADGAPEDSSVELSAAYIRFHGFPGVGESSLTPIPGVPVAPATLAGKLTVSGGLIDIVQTLDLGGNGLGGFDTARFVSSGDIRLTVGDASTAKVGRLYSPGALVLESAQTYVTTASVTRPASHEGFLIASDRSVEFRANGRPAPIPYSYGEKLTVRAPDITQGGVLRAPLGQIDLVATNALVLAPGSLTSVSLEGRPIPMGAVAGGFVSPFPMTSEEMTLDKLIANNPTKRILLDGKSVEVREGATVDVSGGGDLRGYEFIPGNGGSRDILNDTGMFAVLPGYVLSAAPVYTKSDLNAGALKPGDSVFLSGVNGLADGVYTLLPAHYAQMEGGFAVKAMEAGFDSLGTTVKLPDGSQLVGGYRTVAGSSVREQGMTRFSVMSQEVFKKYSAYNEYGYNRFLDEQATKAGVTVPRLPRDAGSLVVRATDTVLLNGRGKFDAPEDGLLGNLDIDAVKIALVGDTQTAPDGYLKLNAKELSGFGIGSLLLGGTRETTVDGVALTVNATNILVANDSASALVIPEVILAATDTVSLSDGAVIRAEGVKSDATADLLLSGNGALLHATTGDRVGITRSGSSTTSGDLVIGENVHLSATGSLSLDGTRAVTNRASAAIIAPQLALSSARISVGDAPVGTDGLVITGDTLAAFGAAQDLLLRSYGAIDFHGAAKLGGTDASGRPVLGKLTLDAAGLNGAGLNGDTAVIAAKELVIGNGFGATSSDTPAGVGNLSLLADTLVIGPGEIATQGFASVSVAADRVSGDGVGAWHQTGDLTIATDLLTSGAGADTAIDATGSVSVIQGRGVSPETEGIGGRLALSGASVMIDTVAALPSGILEVSATAGDLTLGDNARLSSRGSATRFFDVTRATAGGTIRLTSTTGSVSVASGASMDVSGDALGGDAGRIEIVATTGVATLNGAMHGAAAAGNAGGSLSLDADTVSDFSALNAKLNAGDFDAERSVRVRSGDLTLAAGETIAAHDVNLRADVGALTVNGSILASGTNADRDGGTVALRAGNGLTLGASALIDVSTGYTESQKGFDTQSGKVSILADGGDVALRSGSRILAGGGVREGGSVVVTAMRVGTTEIRVNEFATTVEGAREVILRGRRDYALSNVTTTNYNTMFTDAGTWMGGAPTIANRLGLGAVEIQPDIRVVSAGNLTLANDVSLHTRRYAGGVPGALNFEAAGDILVNGSVSDGFSTATNAGVLQTGRSWSLGFSAGRDITVGNTTTGRIIRTGTGDITVNAGRDLLLKSAKSVIYTAGSKVDDAVGFDRGARLGEYPVNGGDIAINAGRDINAPVSADFVTAWLFRYGFADTSSGLSQSQMTVGSQSSWSVVTANFEQGVGALGGGNIAVKAGNDIKDLAVVLPTTGQQTTAIGDSVLTGDLVVRGGGNLKMVAGGDILGGVTMLGRGEAELVAGDAMTSGSTSLQRKTLTVTSTATSNYVSRDLHALFALSDAALTLRARSGVAIEGIVDAMMIPSVGGNRTVVNGNRITFFDSYTERTKVDAATVAGDFLYLNNPWAGADLARGQTVAARQIHQNMSVPANNPTGATVISHDMIYAPGSLSFAALQGGVEIAHRYPTVTNHAFRLSPSPTGNLELLAADSLVTNTPIVMMDVATEYRRTALAPLQNSTQGPNAALLLNSSQELGVTTNYGRGDTPLHAGDATPARLYSTNGDIAGDSELISKRFTVYLPKAAMLKAGGDITNVTLAVQHNDDESVSVMEAGRDIIRPNIRVMGEGSLFVEAGRDIDLTTTGKTSAIQTVGNVGNLFMTNDTSSLRLSNTVTNVALRNAGADITLTAGAADADYAGFADRYLNPANAGNVVRNYLPELRAFMAARGVSGDDATLLAEFAGLPAAAAKSFLHEVYFTELKETGIDVTNPDSPRHGSYARGFDAIKSLFGEPGASSGDINLFGRPLSTREGGDITVLAPHGEVLVDVITNPAADSEGIVTQKGGNLLMMTHADIALANSRVFTLQGGDVLMWTSVGNITAGSGSATKAKPPALSYLVDSDANVFLNASSLQTGAGIGVLDANKTGTVNSRLDLIAPAGTVDAGDAGIRSVGKINIAAQTIIGAANISAGGGVTGITAAPTVNVAAVASANGSAATSGAGAPDAAEQQRNQAMAAQEQTPSVWAVEVLGYGGGSDEEKKEVTTAANDAGDGATARTGIKS